MAADPTLTRLVRRGADFAELYEEHSSSLLVHLEDGRVEKVLQGDEAGQGLRVLAGEQTYYTYSQSLGNHGARFCGSRKAPSKTPVIRIEQIMKTIGQGLISLYLLIASGMGNAYELGTPGRLTYEAYKRSTLSDPKFLSDFGLKNGTNQLGEFYYDVSGSTIIERSRQSFEQHKRRMPSGVERLSIEGWLMRGAIREDDAEGEPNPQDDPYNPNLKRPLHRFFDPAFNRPLTVTGLSIIDSDFHKAPDWAVGSRNPFSSPIAQEYARRNHFTVFDAREAMYRALTGRDNQGAVVANSTAR